MGVEGAVAGPKVFRLREISVYYIFGWREIISFPNDTLGACLWLEGAEVFSLDITAGIAELSHFISQFRHLC